MKKIAILADTSVFFSKEYLKKHPNLKIIELGLNLKNQLKKITNKDDLAYYLEKNMITTSQCSLETIKNTCYQILKEYNQIIIFSISKKLSSLYYNYLKILENNKEFKNKIFVVDNLSTSSLLAKQIDYCLTFIEKNQDNQLEINKFLNNLNSICQNIIKNQKNFIFLNSLMPLIGGGRVNKKIIKLSEKLKLKFILTLQNGELKKIAKIRTIKKGMIKFLNKTINQNLNIEKIDVRYSSYENIDLKRYLEEYFQKNKNWKINFLPFSDILISHLGINVIGVTIWIKN